MTSDCLFGHFDVTCFHPTSSITTLAVSFSLAATASPATHLSFPINVACRCSVIRKTCITVLIGPPVSVLIRLQPSLLLLYLKAMPTTEGTHFVFSLRYHTRYESPRNYWQLMNVMVYRDVRSGPILKGNEGRNKEDKGSRDEEKPSKDTSIAVALGCKDVLAKPSSESPIVRTEDLTMSPGHDFTTHALEEETIVKLQGHGC
ncbi:hypothetical protein IW261DRAFT_1067333 [Armillaria novae-zelandiae]|uniref:Uncharacterized protein n=1 Tax=Armillaria novae-zelandiae TaxID=153914 RepID=A0AA39PC33_9AGAR|nr:hypothetical protein IW261DRAFT_1067333 [Armillaria novae-zelandiae]